MMSNGPRRVAAEIRFGEDRAAVVHVGSRALHQYWNLASPHFREVLLAPQRRTDDEGAVSWSWKEPEDAKPLSASELGRVRKRLAEANRSFLESPDAHDDSADGRNAQSIVHELKACLKTVVEGLAGKSDPELARFVCRTESGPMVHSWGATVPARPFYPDELECEINGTVFVGEKPSAGHEVVMENDKGLRMARTRSDRAGAFLFPKVGPGRYRVRVLPDRIRFPLKGTLVTVERGSSATVELRSAASASEPPAFQTETEHNDEAQPAGQPRRRRWRWLVVFLALLVTGGAGWIWRTVNLNKTSDSISAASHSTLIPEKYRQADRHPTSAAARSDPRVSSTLRTSAGLTTGGRRRGATDTNARESTIELSVDESSGSHRLRDNLISDPPASIASADASREPSLGGSRADGAGPPAKSSVRASSKASASKKAASTGTAVLAENAPASAVARSDAVEENEPTLATSDAAAASDSASEKNAWGAGHPQPASSVPETPPQKPAGDGLGEEALTQPENDRGAPNEFPRSAVLTKSSVNVAKKKTAPKETRISIKNKEAAPAENERASEAALATGSADPEEDERVAPPEEKPRNEHRSGHSHGSSPPTNTGSPPEGPEEPGAATISGAEAGVARRTQKQTTKTARSSASEGQAGKELDGAESARAAGSASAPTSSGETGPSSPGHEQDDGTAQLDAVSEDSSAASHFLDEPALPRFATDEMSIRMPVWRVELVRDSIVPTHPVPLGEMDEARAMRKKLVAEQRSRVPATLRALKLQSGCWFELSAEHGAVPLRWRDEAGNEITDASVHGVRAEVAFAGLAYSRTGDFVLASSAGEEFARVTVDENGSVVMKTRRGVRGGCWIGAERAVSESAGRFRWEMSNGMSPASRDDAWLGGRGHRIDVSFIEGPTSSVDLALVDLESGWALAGGFLVERK